MAEALQSNVTPEGVNQGDLVRALANLRDVVNELQADHATFRTVVADNKTAVNAVITAAATSLAAVAGVTAVTSSAPAALTNSTAITLNKG